MKLTKRKQFSFYRSYYDVYNELSKEDKLNFIEALLDKQFLNIEPSNLTGMVKFAYISQMDSINKQVKGYEDKTGVKLNPLARVENTPTQGGKNTPSLQEKEEEKEKEEEEEEGLIDDVLFTIEILRDKYLQDERIVKSVCEQNKITKEFLENRLTQFNKHLESSGIYSKKWSDYTKHFLNWNKKAPKEITNLTDAEKHKAWLSKTISF